MSAEDHTPQPATAAGKQAADDPTRQRPLDSGGAESEGATAEWAAPDAEKAHGEAIAAAAADEVHQREADVATQEADAARDQAETLSRKERKAREKAEKEREKAERERQKADDAIRQEQGDALATAAEADAKAAQAGAQAASDPAIAAGVHQPDPQPAYAPPNPPVTTPPDDKPEVMVGAAFAGAFLFAKLLKRITNR